MITGRVVAVHRSGTHSFSKRSVDAVTLIAGLGVQGDAHCGAVVKHRGRVAADPSQPNLRQVHLIHRELFDDVARRGFEIGAGDLGENVTTSGLDLLGLPTGAVLALGPDALVAVTGLRNPCRQIDDFRPGVLGAVLDRDETGSLVRKAGVMGVVVRSGVVRPGDEISVALPPEPHHALDRV